MVAALRALPGVADAELEPELGDPGGLGALRVRLLPGADEVDVARAADRLLRTHFAMAVDAERVHLVEDDGAGLRGRHAAKLPPVPPPAPVQLPAPDVGLASPRVAIERLQLSTTGLLTTVTIRLSRHGVQTAGVADGTTNATGVHRAVALATLRAVQSIVKAPCRFEIEHVEIATTGSLRTAVVVVTMVTELGGERLSGASVVREDTRQAVVRATLAAVNRRLEGLPDPRPGPEP